LQNAKGGKVKTETIHVRITEDLKKKLKKYCIDKNVNMSELILRLVEKEINK